MSGSNFIGIYFARYLKFKRIRAEIKAAVDVAHRNYLEKIESEILINSNKFWAYASNKNGSDKVANIMTSKKELLDNPSDILNIFAQFFMNSFIQSTASDAVVQDYSASHLNVNGFKVNDILVTLKSFKPRRTIGPDDITAFSLKDKVFLLYSEIDKWAIHDVHKILVSYIQQENCQSQLKIIQTIGVMEETLCRD